MTVNKASRVDNYLIPKVHDIFSTLAGGGGGGDVYEIGHGSGIPTANTG